MFLRLRLNEMVLQPSEHELSLRQPQPDGPGRILVNRRAAANLVNADDPIRPDHLHHDPPLHSVPRFPDHLDRTTPRFWTVSLQHAERLAEDCALSGTRLMTQFERITSAVLSAIGKCLISPRRNWGSGSNRTESSIQRGRWPGLGFRAIGRVQKTFLRCNGTTRFAACGPQPT